MTVASTDCVVSYAGVISGVPLAVPFSVFAVDEIDVYKAVDGTPAIFGTDYTVALAPPNYDSATVTPVATLAGFDIRIVRDTAAIQPLIIQQNQRLPERALTREYDRGVLRDQELAQKTRGALRGPPGETLGTLPAASLRGLSILAFDSAGQPFVVPTVQLLIDQLTKTVLPTSPPDTPSSLWLQGDVSGGYFVCVTAPGLASVPKTPPPRAGVLWQSGDDISGYSLIVSGTGA